MKKYYLGDGVYLETDGYDIKLTTENGVSVTNVIFLNIEMLESALAKIQGN